MLTSLFAGLLGVFYIFLSLQIISLRRKFKIALGESKENFLLTRYIRSHANFNEYTPIFLVLLFLLENSGSSWVMIGFLGVIFCFGRLLHAYSLMKAEQYDEQNRITALPKFRMAGMIMTFSSIGICAFLNLLSFLG